MNSPDFLYIIIFVTAFFLIARECLISRELDKKAQEDIDYFIDRINRIEAENLELKRVSVEPPVKDKEITPKEIFTSAGKLTKCKNKIYDFVFLNVIFMFQWSSDGWSAMTDRGKLQNYFLMIGTSEKTDGDKLYKIIFWRLNICFAFL